MKRLIFTSIVIMVCLNTYAQEAAFAIKEIGSKYSTEQLTNAMKTADWCGFYYDKSKRVLNFDDGAVVELKSARELSGVNTDYNPSCTSAEESVDKNTYSVHSSGRILIRVEKLNVVKDIPAVR